MIFDLESPKRTDLADRLPEVVFEVGGSDIHAPVPHLDCAHFVRLVHHLAGINYPLPVIRNRDWALSTPRLMFDHFNLHLCWQRPRIVKPLDLLIITLLNPYGDHLAVYLGDLKLVHLWNSKVQVGDVLDNVVAAFTPQSEPS